jgi:hypothetical protein
MQTADGLYLFMERAAPYFAMWSCAFTIITSVRVVGRIKRGIAQVPDSAVWTELAGLPLTLLQSVAFVWALIAGDFLSALLFAWWGPGFIATVVAIIISKRRRQPINWYPLRLTVSYLCKLIFLAYIAVFISRDMPGMIFAFSAWIINDQVEKMFMSLDADRLRRTFHDRWLFRILYPAGLLAPLIFPNMAWRGFSLTYGVVLLALWISGIVYVARKGKLFVLPNDPSLLRNMVYFPRLR